MSYEAIPTPVSEVELLELTVQGDREAFGTLVRRYQSLVCSLAYSIVGDVARSEDVAQETFVAAWKSLATLEDRAKFKAWLCGIARNVALRGLRRDSKTVSADGLPEAQSFEPSPLDGIIEREEAALVWEVLRELPENYREPLVLFYREEQSVARVAEALDLSEDAARQRLSRGREMLRMQVAATVERALTRSRPGPIFTAAVLGVLPAFAASSAVAATGAASKVSIPLAKAGMSAAVLSTLVGWLGGLGGAGVGMWAAYQTAQFQRQRDLLRNWGTWFVVMFVMFMSPYLAAELDLWRPNDVERRKAVALQFFWFSGWFTALFVWSWRMGREYRKIMAEETAAGTAKLPPTSFSRWIDQFEGRQWSSRWSFCGLPLIDIRFTNPRRASSELSLAEAARPPKWARGWIALGDKAQGVLFAAGSIAVGGVGVGGTTCGLVSIGGLTFGILPIGGLAIGLFPIGGMAIGLAAFGGLACGWWALGGGAIAWQAANAGPGGTAYAHDYAIGQRAYAAHANDEVAGAFFRDHAFFSRATEIIDSMTPYMQSPWVFILLVAIGLSLPITLALIGYRRRRPA